ncbi:MAG TPA: transposase family protein, partial [Beijerinckiaceae bacterium]|nr:transposase family protein [Beijerinckiaceae bacterium]
MLIQDLLIEADQEVVMSDAAELSPGRTLWEALGDIPDRRGAKGRRYPLRSVLTLSLAAMLAGGND